jgi:hypothetical protein
MLGDPIKVFLGRLPLPAVPRWQIVTPSGAPQHCPEITSLSPRPPARARRPVWQGSQTALTLVGFSPGPSCKVYFAS